jgi:UDP-glucuronate 4-epimerase
MKYFITGSRGFIARHLIKTLQGDVQTCERMETTDILDAFEPDIIFHLGAELKNNEKMFESNVLLTMKILDYCARKKPKLLVLFGSSSEYGYSTHVMSEDDLPNPQTVYAGTKTATAMLAKVWSKEYGIPILYVRPFTIYGEDEKPTKLTQILFNKWRNNQALDLTEGVHDYMYVDDFVDILLRIVPLHTDGFDIINIGSGVETTNFQFVREFENATGHSFHVHLKDGIKETEVWCADVTKLKTKYGVHVNSDLTLGIKRMVARYLNGTSSSSSDVRP